MLEAALAGAVAGYAIAIPVGAIAVLIIHTGLTGGLRHGLAAGAGAASADGIYATIAALAGAGVTALIGPLEAPLRAVGGVVLVGIGAYGFITAWRSRDHVVAAYPTAHRPHGRTYLALLGLTLLNPATVIYFAALTVGLPFLGDLSERLVFAGAAFVASLSWQSLLAVFGAMLGRGAGHRLRLPTALVGNLIVIGLGIVVLAGTLAPAATSQGPMRAGVLMAVLLLAACAGASPSPAPDPVRIIATDLPLIEQPFTVAVIDNANDYETGWAHSSRSAPPPDVAFETEVVVYLGMAGSSTCPETFQHLVVDAEAAHVYGEWGGSSARPKDMPCTDDLAGQGVVLAVSRSVLPQGEFTLTLREALMCSDCPDHPDQAIVDLP